MKTRRAKFVVGTSLTAFSLISAISVLAYLAGNSLLESLASGLIVSIIALSFFAGVYFLVDAT